MRKLTTEQVISMHAEIIRATGGSLGIRDEGLLLSALNAPFQSFGGCDVYPTIYHKAARLGFGLAKNHAFIDGNKRMAAHVVLTFLSMNGIEIECTEFELFSIFFRLASSEITFEELLDFLINKTLPV